MRKSICSQWNICTQQKKIVILIYKAFCLDVAESLMNRVQQWDSNSLVKVCYSILLNITPPGVPMEDFYNKMEIDKAEKRFTKHIQVQSVGAVEYTNCISAEA